MDPVSKDGSKEKSASRRAMGSDGYKMLVDDRRPSQVLSKMPDHGIWFLEGTPYCHQGA